VRRAVFVDRDGVVNELVTDPVSGLPESPLDPDQVVLIRDAAPALVRLHQAGYLLVGVSNQPAAAKGVVGLDDLQRVQTRVLRLLEHEGVTFDSFELCFHHPHGAVTELTRTCGCRKPAPGMLLTAADELGLDLEGSWLVGDTDDDTRAASAAGCRTVLVENPGSLHKRTGSPSPWALAADLAAAADVILRDGR
jgi:D-glycero-D-manno-heptose 1,7-bisphosphate phosphatase